MLISAGDTKRVYLPCHKYLKTITSKFTRNAQNFPIDRAGDLEQWSGNARPPGRYYGTFKKSTPHLRFVWSKLPRNAQKIGVEFIISSSLALYLLPQFSFVGVLYLSLRLCVVMSIHLCGIDVQQIGMAVRTGKLEKMLRIGVRKKRLVIAFCTFSIGIRFRSIGTRLVRRTLPEAPGP